MAYSSDWSCYFRQGGREKYGWDGEIEAEIMTFKLRLECQGEASNARSVGSGHQAEETAREKNSKLGLIHLRLLKKQNIFSEAQIKDFLDPLASKHIKIKSE